MTKLKKDKGREDRIANEIIVDAYDETEKAMGWYYYLDENLHFPFPAKCIATRSISSLEVGDEVDVISMAPEEECDHEMFVMIRGEKRGLAVPLSQLKGIKVDEETKQAIDDWRYWVEMGYEF